MKLFTTWPEMKQEVDNCMKKCEIVRKTKLPVNPKLFGKNAVWT
jgi:hypothetical protein